MQVSAPCLLAAAAMCLESTALSRKSGLTMAAAGARQVQDMLADECSTLVLLLTCSSLPFVRLQLCLKAHSRQQGAGLQAAAPNAQAGVHIHHGHADAQVWHRQGVLQRTGLVPAPVQGAHSAHQQAGRPVCLPCKHTAADIRQGHRERVWCSAAGRLPCLSPLQANPGKDLEKQR